MCPTFKIEFSIRFICEVSRSSNKKNLAWSLVIAIKTSESTPDGGNYCLSGWRNLEDIHAAGQLLLPLQTSEVELEVGVANVATGKR